MCPCGGKHRYKWHQTHGIPQCDYSKSIRQQQERDARRRKAENQEGWIPGSPILIEEMEEL